MINIAIDGPSGAGKSTIARLAAAELGYLYIDTGALYRSIGVAAVRNGIEPSDNDSVTKILPDITISLKFIDGIQHVFLNDEDVSDEIRLPYASKASSNVSKHPSVRQYLFNLQKDIALKNNCLMDGRDIGTVVLPNADVKIFLTASAEVRAKRRFDELIEKGNDVEFETVLKDIEERDYNDSHREIAPLKKADDAIMIDCSELTVDEVKNKIIEIIKEKVN